MKTKRLIPTGLTTLWITLIFQQYCGLKIIQRGEWGSFEIRWLNERYDMGWEYGTPECKEREFVRRHEDLIPNRDFRSGEKVEIDEAQSNYDRLNKSEQTKDTEPMKYMLTLLKMFGSLRIYRYFNSSNVKGK